MRDERGRQLNRALDAPAQQIDRRLTGTERHVDRLGADITEQCRARKVRVAAGAGIADAYLFRIGFGVSQHLLEVFPRSI